MNNNKTLIIGIGGMGGNAINNLIASDNKSGSFLCISTNAQAMQHSLAPQKLLIGEEITKGKGSGGNVSVGKAVAESSLQEIAPYITNADTVFLIAGLGGGTGSGAIQVIGNYAQELGKHVVCIVTTPFQFEGGWCDITANETLRELDKIGVQKRVFNNQDLFKTANERTTFADAFKMADASIGEWIGEVINDAT